jgi:hypothetical protein
MKLEKAQASVADDNTPATALLQNTNTGKK